MNTPLTQSTRRMLAVSMFAAAMAAAALLPAGAPPAHAQSADAAADTIDATSPRPPMPAPNPRRPGMASVPNPTGGSIVFLSDRPGSGPSGVNQVWLKKWLAFNNAPVQLTSEPNGARSPVWFPRTDFGPLVAYITRDGAGNDVIKIIGSDKPWMQLWSYDYAVDDLGTAHIDYLTWSNDGLKLCFAHYNEWYSRGLACLTFPESLANFDLYSVQSVVAIGHNPAPSESAFSLDDETIYFSGDKGVVYRGYMYSVPAAGGVLPKLLRDNTGQGIRTAFAPSVGTDGTSDVLIYNSECYTADPKRGEELLMLNLQSGVVTELTNVPGNQYGSFLHTQGGGWGFAMQSNADLTIPAPQAHPTNYDLFLSDTISGSYTKVDIDDAGNYYSDFAPDWIS